MTEHQYCMVWVTCPSEAVATDLAAQLVEQQLAACVQVVSGVTSVYTWQGRLQQDAEWLMVIKTTIAAYDAVERYIMTHHPYDVPECIALPIIAGSPPYLDWLSQSIAVPNPTQDPDPS